MRESRTFAQRTRVLSSDEVRKKYFLVYEGSDTEALYFEQVNVDRGQVGINPLIELIPLMKSYSEKGWSNPEKILNRVIQNLEEANTGCISYETLLNRIMYYFEEEDIISSDSAQAKTIWGLMKSICEKELERDISYDVDNLEEDCRYIINSLREKTNLINVISDISEIIKLEEVTYAKEIDKICLIVDRDRESFRSEQYEEVKKKCREKGFGFYITNPCFEFWLLMHFDEVFRLDKEKLLENSKVITKRRYTEQELRKLLPNYRKSKYDTKTLIGRIDKAIENEKEFCENVELLEHTVGSNIGLLIEEMRQ